MHNRWIGLEGRSYQRPCLRKQWLTGTGKGKGVLSGVKLDERRTRRTHVFMAQLPNCLQNLNRFERCCWLDGKYFTVLGAGLVAFFLVARAPMEKLKSLSNPKRLSNTKYDVKFSAVRPSPTWGKAGISNYRLVASLLRVVLLLGWSIASLIIIAGELQMKKKMASGANATIWNCSFNWPGQEAKWA